CARDRTPVATTFRNYFDSW
nr:immunoglobulin heavy chain junction region [Macaca mulatta]